MGKILVISILLVLSFSLNSNSQESNTYRVGELSNRSFKMKYGGFIATWDGRVVLFPQHMGTENHYRWVSYLLRFENIKLNNKNEPNLLDPNIYSPLVTLDSDTPLHSQENQMGVMGRMHLTLVPDPDYKINPFPSDINGKVTSNLNSEYKTYRTIFVGQAQESIYYKPTKSIPGLFVVSTGEIIVKDLGKPTAEIVSAKVLKSGEVIRENSASEPFFGFEPTISNDGRLLIYAGNPNNGGIHFIMYSFNPSPKKGSGWSKPRHLTEMYYAHGAGSANEPVIDGIKFSDKYPIAKKILKDPFGKNFAPQDGYPGAYPWLTLDNSDLFCATVSTFFAARRSGYSVIGALTNHTARNVDSMINISRSNVTGRSDVWTVHEEGKELEKKYNQLTDENNKPYGTNAFQRIMVSPIGQFPSMWNFALENPNLKSTLPFSNKENTFGIIMSHSDRYVEVSLPESQDPNYVLYLPMNEALSFNRSYMKKMASSKEVKDWNDNHNMVTYDPQHTPDISGRFQTGTLYNAQFPFEYFEAEKKWKEKRELVDKFIEIEGNSIFFKPKSFVGVTLNNETLSDLSKTKEINISFFIRSYQNLTQEQIFLWKDFLSIKIDQRNIIIQKNSSGNWKTILSSVTPLQENQWQHMSLNITNSNLELYWNGQLLSTTQEGLELTADQKDIYIGSIKSISRSSSALYSIDDFSISKVTRNKLEIQKQALWNTKIESASKNTSPLNPEEILLGKKLFHDPILSKDKTISCATCHVPKNNFQDGLSVAIGIQGQKGTRNTPSLWNISEHSPLMWDGRAKDLEEQALMPITNPIEMNLELSEAIARLKEKYLEDFKSVYNSEPTSLNLAQALSSFQKTIKPQPSVFDLNQLNQKELLGRGLFMGKARCVSCHQGTLFSDFSMHNVGLIESPTDKGLFNVTKRTSDIGKFKTPSLRMIQFTAPYFHDGRFESLKEVIEFYNRGGDTTHNRDFSIQELGLNAEEVEALEAFLKTL